MVGILDSGSAHAVGSYQLLWSFIKDAGRSPLVQAKIANQDTIRVVDSFTTDKKLKMTENKEVTIHLVDAPRWDKLLVGQDVLSVMKWRPKDQLRKYYGKTITIKNLPEIKTNVCELISTDRRNQADIFSLTAKKQYTDERVKLKEIRRI